jgi:hypothetical protein
LTIREQRRCVDWLDRFLRIVADSEIGHLVIAFRPQSSGTRLENTVFPDSNPARIMALRRCDMLFLAKWPNGDFSLVQAQNRDQAFVVLDDADDPGEAKIVPISEEEGVIINFKATSPRSDSDGLYEFEDLGEDLADALTNRAEPS